MNNDVSVIAGVDWSMSSPAITIHTLSNDLRFDKMESHYMATRKRDIGKISKNIFGYEHTKYENNIERYDNITEWAINIFEDNGVNHIILEDYALGSRAGMVFNIAEHTGILKYKLHLLGITVDLVSPPQLKKWFTGKGNAKKDLMYQYFIKDEGSVDLEHIFSISSLKNPISDIVDSYSLVKYGATEL